MNKVFPFLRVLLGMVFVTSGLEKVMHPWQEFLFSLQGYQAFPIGIENLIAQTFPWVELAIGILVVLGLYTIWALRATMGMVAVFILMISQAILRGIDLSDCGCFGSLIQLPAQYTLIFDIVLIIVTFLLIKFIDKTQNLSLDKAFE